jgi:ABC-type lipoprotein release transport system permease subunit
MNKTLPPGSRWASRVRVSAIASNARHSAGITLVGIEPEKEAKISFIGDKAIVEGHYLKPDEDNGIVVGRALLDKFETQLGYKLVLMSQDTNKEIASRAFRIVGVFQGEMEATEKQFVFVNISSAREMLRLEQGISEISAILPQQADVKQIADNLKSALPQTYEIHTWREILSAMTAYLEIFDGFMILWYVVVFIAMGFGIVNTMLMAVFERMREFGMLKALGMKPGRIIREVLTESFFLLVTGMAIGNILSFLSVFALSGSGINLSALAEGAEYAGISRIVYPVIQTRDLTLANLIVFILGLLISLYPAIKAAKFTPVEAMAHN